MVFSLEISKVERKYTKDYNEINTYVSIILYRICRIIFILRSYSTVLPVVSHQKPLVRTYVYENRFKFHFRSIYEPVLYYT